MVDTQNGRYTWIDSLKGIAICAVVMIHSGAGNLPSIWGVIGNAGKYGVQLFLLISAYLAYASLNKAFGKQYHLINIKTVVPWWIHKIIRLAPLYYVAVVLALFVEGLGGRYWLGSCDRITCINIVTHFLFLHGVNPYYVNSIIGGEWYLAVLVAYFILAPWLYKYINSLIKAGSLFLISTIVSYVLNCIAVNMSFINDTYLWEEYIKTFWLPTQFPILALGAVLYLLMNEEKLLWERCNQKKYSYLVWLLAICMTVCQLFEVHQLFKVSRFVTWAICFSFIIVGMGTSKCPLLNNVIFKKIGKLSYPIYLIHLRLISLFERYIQKDEILGVGQWMGKYLGIMLLSYFLSFVLVKYFETPVTNLLLRGSRLRFPLFDKSA